MSELEETQRERDQYYSDVQYWRERALAAEAENAAMDQERSRYRLEAMKLAAHVERLSDLECALSGAYKGTEEYDDKLHALRRAIDDGPETSLARRDALTKIEALSWVAGKLPCGVDITARYIANRLEELRRQAEGEQS